MSDVTTAQALEAGVALWRLLADDPAARRAFRVLAAEPKAIRLLVKLLDDSFPKEANGTGRSQRKARPRPKAKPEAEPKAEPEADDVLGRAEVLAELGISPSWFQKLVNDPASELGKVVFKEGNRWKIKRGDLHELVKQRAKDGILPPPKGDRPW